MLQKVGSSDYEAFPCCGCRCSFDDRGRHGGAVNAYVQALLVQRAATTPDSTAGTGIKSVMSPSIL